MSAGWGSLRRRLAPALLAMACWPALAADIWGYVDAQGVAHFATEQVDARYGLFFRTGVDSAAAPAAPGPAPEAAAARVPVPATRSAPSLSPRLDALFAGSPTYRGAQAHLREASATHGIDYELLKALILTESGFNAQAVSPKGAVGLMQIMPATAQRYGVASDRKMAAAQKLTDPKTNIRTGSRYLRDLLNLFPGRLDLALAAYNAGEGAVQRAGNRIPNYRETQNYVRTVMALYTALKPEAPLRVEARNAPQGRVRMVLGGPPANGGAALRGNMPPSLADPLQPSWPAEPPAPLAPLGAASLSGPPAPTSALLPGALPGAVPGAFPGAVPGAAAGTAGVATGAPVGAAD